MKGVLAITAMGAALAASVAQGADPFDEALAHAHAGRFGAAAAGFRALAEADDPEAAYNLAMLFSSGHGLPQNFDEAAYWAWRARLAGLQTAAPLIATLMAELPQDRQEKLAVRLEDTLLPEATRGDGAAMLALAAVLTSVRPAPDLILAYGWQSIAAATDTPGAVAARNDTLAKLPPEQRPLAQDHALAAFVEWCAAQETPDLAPACAAIAR